MLDENRPFTGLYYAYYILHPELIDDHLPTLIRWDEGLETLLASAEYCSKICLDRLEDEELDAEMVRHIAYSAGYLEALAKVVRGTLEAENTVAKAA